ncbi:MAG: TatD family hydrolase [Armatimonadia bacterium]
MRLFDSHCHLNDPKLGADLPEVLRSARAAGLVGMMVVGYDLVSSQFAADIAAREGDCWAAVGLHPHDASDADEALLAQLRELAGQPRVKAIGETGLDYFRNLSPRPDQRRAFEAFIGMSAELGLPLIVHCREAQEDVLEVLDANRQAGQTVVMHCFAGGVAFAEECLQRGFYLGLAGTITYPKSFALRQVAKEAPLERLLIETDAPWLPPQAYRGKRNEPAYVALVAETVAEERGMTVEEIGEATERNAREAFGVDERGCTPRGDRG